MTRLIINAHGETVRVAERGASGKFGALTLQVAVRAYNMPLDTRANENGLTVSELWLARNEVVALIMQLANVAGYACELVEVKR